MSKSCVFDRNYVYGKTEYRIRFHLLLTCHVIPRMRNANFVNTYGDFWTLQYLLNCQMEKKIIFRHNQCLQSHAKLPP